MLFFLFAVVGGVVAWVGSTRVADACTRDRLDQADTVARRQARESAARAAEEVRILLDDARQGATMLAREIGHPGAAAGAGPIVERPFEPLGVPGRLWSHDPADGVFALLPPGAETESRALLGWASRLAPLLHAITDDVSGVRRATLTLGALGTVGAPSDWLELQVRDGSLLHGVDEELRESPQAPAWTESGPGRFVFATPVSDESGIPVGTVRVEVSAEAVRRVLDTVAAAAPGPGEPGAARGWVLVSGTGEVLTACAGADEALALEPDAGLDAISAVLRPLLGGAGVFYPPEAGFHVVSAGRRVAAAGVRDMPFSVAWVGPAAVPALTEPASAETARRFGLAVAALATVFGAVCVLAAAALGRVHALRSRTLLAGVEAHEQGLYGHVVSVPGDDEVSEVARWMNTAAARLRHALARGDESERRLASLIESMGDGFATTDVDDRIVHVNHRFADLLRRPASTLSGRFVEELLQPDSIERYRTHVQRLREGRAVRFEASWISGPATSLRTIVSGVPLFDGDGRPAGSYVVLTDLTDKVRVHEEVARAEKVRALAEMAGGVAHDFNNVLTVILGNAQYLLLESLTDEARSTLSAIERAALDGTETVRRIREFSRTRSVPGSADLVSVDAIVERVVEEAKARFVAAGDDRAARMRVVVRRNSRRRVRGNADELSEALANVVQNALEAMPEGGALTVETFDRGEDAVAIRVEDTGMGIRPEHLDRIFDPFWTTKPAGRCAGLGLSIAFGILRAHRGRIDIRSQVGHGSTFTIVLPAALEQETVNGPASAGGARIDPRILLVGGEPGEMQSLLNGLRALGVYAASVHPASALALAADVGIFNTLAVEYDLGAATGWELARQARANRPDLCILLFTTPAHPVSETQARNAGIDRVLVRPFDVRDVHAEVFALLASPRALAAPPAPASKRTRRGIPKHHRDEGTHSSTSEVWWHGTEDRSVPSPGDTAAGDTADDGRIGDTTVEDLESDGLQRGPTARDRADLRTSRRSPGEASQEATGDARPDTPAPAASAKDAATRDGLTCDTPA